MIFILDEFDLFAKPFKQTVLYNLLDALQTSSVQVREVSSICATTACRACLRPNQAARGVKLVLFTVVK